MGSPHRRPPPRPPPTADNIPAEQRCGQTTAECAAACALCICCPLALVCCSLRFPFRAARRLRLAASSSFSCCVRSRSFSGFSSSFSDIDFEADRLPVCGVNPQTPVKKSRFSFPLWPWRCSRHSDAAQ
ncbi:hypothetical protein KSP39_PZI015830 [Platanthera zijinensis]|uniref:Uncharacterized protein n=1 Tax=Platanthera zijinensis TaxID=2320716 RepID=A0AAP0B887_9ASPA